MTDLLNLGSSTLLSLQRAIATTGHNISNANTDGYSRQRVNFVTQTPAFEGGAFIGNGMRLDSVERFYDQFLSAQLLARTATQQGAQTGYELSTRLDGLLSDPAVGLAPAMSAYFDALQDVANNPGGLPERQALLGQAQALADRMHALDTQLRGLDTELNGRIQAATDEINTLAQGIAEINRQIVETSARANGETPNDLLDERDRLLNRLAEKVSVNVVAQSDGALNVNIGSGQPLVVGFTAERLQTAPNPFDGNQLLVGTPNANGSVTDLARFINGGELGALLDYRGQQLNDARNQLGLVATGLTATINAQHALGMDLQGDLGNEFFTPLNPTYGSHPNNSGSATLNLSFDDVGALTGDDYRLNYDGSTWTVTNLGSGATLSGPGPFTVDGVNIAISGAASAGDSFLIQPTRQGATLFGVAVNDPQAIAAAGPVRAEDALANTGSGTVSGLATNDVSGMPLGSPVVLTFNPDAMGPGVPGFDVAGTAGGPLAYDPASEGAGKTFSIAGFEFTVAGTPANGDQFNFVNNTSGTGDNSNALAMGELQTARELFNGTASYQDAYGRLVADIGVQTQQAKTTAETESVLFDQAVAARDSVSGVNLDEEAANLIRYQQAYQAAAQVIAVADEVFQTLLNATRR